ncbi:MAG: hypothetical protein J0M20_04745 [Burkholderiales bacterium]|nr:hypothetical protein [Burkholderiales bacterium]
MTEWKHVLAAVGIALISLVAQGQPKIGAIGIFSLLGDGVDVTSNDDAPRDTRIDRISRQTMEFNQIGFDRIALREAREALRQHSPDTVVKMYVSPTPLSTDQQRSLASGAAKAELPGWMVRALGEARLTHLMIITRTRGSMVAHGVDGFSVGRGQVDGIGFHLDTLYTIRNARTGALSTGLLAPYLQVKLQLMDAQSGEILASYDIRDASIMGAPDTQVRADPWSFVPNEDKVAVLRELVETGMRRAVPKLLATP